MFKSRGLQKVGRAPEEKLYEKEKQKQKPIVKTLATPESPRLNCVRSLTI